MLFHIGIYHSDGLAYAQPVSDVISAVFTLIMTLWALSRFRKLTEKEAPKEEAA